MEITQIERARLVTAPFGIYRLKKFRRAPSYRPVRIQHFLKGTS